MSEQFPFEKLKHGNFLQVLYNDGTRIANRAFQLYDKDANKELSVREVQGMIKNIYKGIDPRKRVPDEELKAYLQVLDKRKTGKIRDQDFQELVEEYFINHNKKGAMDFQLAYPEHFHLAKKEGMKKTPADIKKELIKIGEARYNQEFIKSQLQTCKELFDKFNVNKDDKIEFEEVVQIFEDIYRKISFLSPKEKLHSDDLKRLMELINYDGDGKIGFEEFEIFFLRGLIGS
jgi:Ca2+-binding EF-hand superfamily protein